MLKKITGGDKFRAFLCWLGAKYISLIYKTGKWEVIGEDIPNKYWQEGKPFILAFWHGRILLMPYSWRRDIPIHMLISQHRDGLLIANTVAHFGINTIAGSTSKGGSAALRAMLKRLKAGDCVGITPDGPRGPRMRATYGIVQVAKMAGVPIIPATFATEKGRNLGSWDRFLLAWPFSKGVFVWGRPIFVPPDVSEAGLESLREEVELRMNAICQAADSRMNRPAVEPAPHA